MGLFIPHHKLKATTHNRPVVAILAVIRFFMVSLMNDDNSQEGENDLEHLI